MMTPEEIRTILERAHEIHHHQQLRLEDSAEVESLVSAAEEAGVPREAMVLALRERLAASNVVLAVGDKAFACSADGRFYVAEVRELGETEARVRFYSGQEETLPLKSLRRFTLLPGQKVSANWPNFGWWGGSVVSYDAVGLRVEVTDWMGTKAWVSLSDIRLEAEVPPGSTEARLRALASTVGVALASGGIGAAITYFLMR